MENIYASCVDFNGYGILITGPSASGKSDLVLRLINEDAVLIADDQCELYTEKQDLIAQAPKKIKGLLEVRNLGIVKLKTKTKTKIKLIVKLTHNKNLARMPKDKTIMLCNLPIKQMLLNPFEISATAKIKLALAIAINKIKMIS